MKLEEAKDYIINNISIVDTIGSYVKLKKSGSSYKGLCPFHSEKTPSFFVNEQKKIFHCFGCGASGDVISFVQKIEGITFFQAIKKLASYLNIEIEFNGDKYKDKNKDEKELAIKIYEIFKNYYKESLLKSEPALNYLKKRNIDKKIIDFFEIGYADQDQKSFIESVIKKYNVDLSFLYKYSLISSLNFVKPFFEKRIIIPIKNIWNDTVAFSGRIITEENLPKYINSKETPIFQKQNLLFNINNIKNLKDEDNLFLVEGYFDVITGYANGLSFLVAPMGTSLTLNQIKILSRKTDRIYLLFDNDSAGFQAFLRSITLFIQSDTIIYPYFVKLPEDVKDIDEFFNKKYTKEQLLKNIYDGYEIYFKKIFEISNKKRNIEKILKNFFNQIIDINDEIRLKFIFKKICEIDNAFNEDELFKLLLKYKKNKNVMNMSIKEEKDSRIQKNELEKQLDIFEIDFIKFIFFHPYYLNILFEVTDGKNLKILFNSNIAINFLNDFYNFIKANSLNKSLDYKVNNKIKNEKNDYDNEKKSEEEIDENSYLNKDKESISEHYQNSEVSLNIEELYKSFFDYILKIYEESPYDYIKNKITEILFIEDKNPYNFDFDFETNSEIEFIKYLKKFYKKKFLILSKKIREKLKNVNENYENLLLKSKIISNKIKDLNEKNYKDLIEFFFEIDPKLFEKLFLIYIILNNHLIEEVKEYVLVSDFTYFSEIYSKLLLSLNYNDFELFMKLEGNEDIMYIYSLYSNNQIFEYNDLKLKKILLFFKLKNLNKKMGIIDKKINELKNKNLKENQDEISQQLEELKKKKQELKLIISEVIQKIKNI